MKDNYKHDIAYKTQWLTEIVVKLIKMMNFLNHLLRNIDLLDALYWFDGASTWS